MTRGIDDSNIVFGSLELPESNIDGDTTFTLGLQFVEHPGVFEGPLSKFGGFLLKFLNGSLIDTTTLVNEMASGRGLARVDVSMELA